MMIYIKQNEKNTSTDAGTGESANTEAVPDCRIASGYER